MEGAESKNDEDAGITEFHHFTWYSKASNRVASPVLVVGAPKSTIVVMSNVLAEQETHINYIRCTFAESATPFLRTHRHRVPLKLESNP